MRQWFGKEFVDYKVSEVVVKTLRCPEYLSISAGMARI